MNSKNNLLYISYLRMAAMLMVVYYHCICCFTPVWGYDDIKRVGYFEGLGVLLNNIHIPLFMTISGYLYGYFIKRGKYQDNKEFIRNKARRLLIPFISWSIVAWFFLSSKSYVTFIVNGASYLWFLGTLFVLFILALILKKTILSGSIIKDVMLFSVFVIISMITLYMPANPGLILYEAANYLFIFMGGAFLSKYVEICSLKISSNRWRLIGFVVSLLMLILTCAFAFKGSVHLQKIFSVTTVCFSILLFEKTKLPSLNKWGSLIDRNCMGIYLIHYIPIHLILRNQFVRIQLSNNPFIHLLLFVIILTGSLLISELLRRNNYTKFLVG